MEMNAVYMMIDDATLNNWTKLDDDDLLDAIYDKEEADETKSLDLAKEWDIIHYYLTGQSAMELIEGDKLSEAIVGVNLFSYGKDADFVSWIGKGDVSEIVKALKDFDLDGYQQRLDKDLMRKQDLYPTGVEETDGLLDLIKDEVKHLIAFYEEALDSKMNVVVSIV